MPKGVVDEREEALAGLLAKPHRASRKPLLVRIAAVWSGFLRKLMPEFPIASYCPSCWAKLELIDDQYVEGQEEPVFIYKGIRFWRCPSCGGGSSEKYTYVNTTQDWEDRFT